jgi:hypothetical protein
MTIMRNIDWYHGEVGATLGSCLFIPNADESARLSPLLMLKPWLTVASKSPDPVSFTSNFAGLLVVLSATCA